MDILLECAKRYQNLCRYEYRCIVAKKKTLKELVFAFTPYEFKHISGLHKVQSNVFHRNSERIFRDILNGTITAEDLYCSENWFIDKDDLISRINATIILEEIMDQFSLIFRYNRNAFTFNRGAVFSKIPADYLIKYAQADGSIFYFTLNCNQKLLGQSLFFNQETDYSIAQTKYTLLEKTKINKSNQSTEVLYTNPHYIKQ